MSYKRKVDITNDQPYPMVIVRLLDENEVELASNSMLLSVADEATIDVELTKLAVSQREVEALNIVLSDKKKEIADLYPGIAVLVEVDPIVGLAPAEVAPAEVAPVEDNSPIL